jgi:hypothetical protein
VGLQQPEIEGWTGGKIRKAGPMNPAVLNSVPVYSNISLNKELTSKGPSFRGCNQINFSGKRQNVQYFISSCACNKNTCLKGSLSFIGIAWSTLQASYISC